MKMLKGNPLEGVKIYEAFIGEKCQKEIWRHLVH